MKFASIASVGTVLLVASAGQALASPPAFDEFRLTRAFPHFIQINELWILSSGNVLTPADGPA